MATTMHDSGQSLKSAIHVARARASIPSDMQLALRAGIHYDTLMNWYGGRTVPRPAELLKVASVLDVSLADLMGAYEGRPSEPPPLHESIRELVAELRAQRVSHDQAMAGLTRALAELASVGTQYVRDGKR